MRNVLTLLFLSVILFSAKTNACDGHSHQSSYTWHTKAIKPLLADIAASSINEKQFYTSIINTLIAEQVHVQEALEKAGLDLLNYKSISEMYREKQGRALVMDPVAQSYIEKMVGIRDQKKWAAESADALYDLYHEIQNNVQNELVKEALLASLQVYIESAQFWDLQMNAYQFPAPNENSRRRDINDLQVFLQTYLTLLEMGIGGENAHIISSLETAYQSATCSDCGMWTVH